MRRHDNYRWGSWRGGTTQRIDQVRSSIARLATLINGHCSVLEEIEKRSNELLGKGKAARFVDKGRDSGEVVKLVERLRDAITRYQVSEVPLCRVEYDLHRRAGFATASDLRTNHRPYCESLPFCPHPLH